MRIKRLHIGDFGILQNQTLEDLHPGLVIVGGCNRAGKSTFMQVLRYLGYGIPSGGLLPPANTAYMIDADVLEENTGIQYHIRLQGQSEPICSIAGQGNRVPASELYGVDSFTYRNLYTISLDQLAREPEGVSSKEMDKLQSALLGAGLTDIANIPRLEEGFTKAANSMGGTKGRLTTKAFKPHIQMIKEGVAAKKKAIAQVEQYQLQQAHLSELQNQKQSLDLNLERTKAKRDILETVKSHYEVLEEITALNHSLENEEGAEIPKAIHTENQSRVEDAYESYRERITQWQQQFRELADNLEKREQAHQIQKLLLQQRTVLQGFYDRLSGLQEKWNHLSSRKEKVAEDKHQLFMRIKGLNANWSEQDISRIRSLQLELLEESRLMNEVTRFQNTRNDLDQTQSQLNDIDDRVMKIKTKIEKWQKQAPMPGLKLYLWAFIVSALLGLAVFFLHPAAGLFLGLFGIIGSGLFVFFKGLGQKEAAIRLKELHGELDGILETQARLQQNKKRLTDQLKETGNYLMTVCKKLGLEQSIPPQGILEYYRAISHIQQGIIRLDKDEALLKEQSEQLADQLHEIKNVLSVFENASAGLRDLHSPRPCDVLQPDTWLDIQSGLKKWHGLMLTAVQSDLLSREADKIRTRILSLMGQTEEREHHRETPETRETMAAVEAAAGSLEDQVDAYLSACRAYSDYRKRIENRDGLLQGLKRAAGSERITKAFSLLADTGPEQILPMQDGSLLEQFFLIYDQYPVKESLEREFTGLMDEIRNQEQVLEECKKKIQATKLSLEQLSLTQELEQAHQRIHQGRNGLYQISYDYAVQKAAAWLCRQVRSEFMAKMKDDLLLKADGILSRLTGGNYQRMIPNDDLTDFSFVLGDGSHQENSRILSRGTREQVFLAVRLGRILEIQPALPVIIDDSLVNFDCAHLKQALAVIGRLSQTHQVFIMTCHPHLVGMLMDSGIPGQYWQLEKGRFSTAQGHELKEYLQLNTEAVKSLA
jgi:uncharacterized protein YhaN